MPRTALEDRLTEILCADSSIEFKVRRHPGPADKPFRATISTRLWTIEGEGITIGRAIARAIGKACVDGWPVPGEYAKECAEREVRFTKQ